MVLAAMVVTALILVNAIYVGAEFAAVSVRHSRVRQLASAGNRLAAWLLPVLQSPAELDRYIAACQVGITLSSMVLGAYAQATIGVWLAPHLSRFGEVDAGTAGSLASVAVLLVLTVAQVVFAELVPKSLALQYPTQSALATLLPMAASRWLYRPFISALNGTAMVLLRMVGADTHGHRHIHSPGEISLLIAESRDGGVLEADEHQRLQRALRLNFRQVRQLMVPRLRVRALDVAMPAAEAIEQAAHSQFSRLPVYRGTIDNVIGVLRTKDIAAWVARQGDRPVALESLVRPLPSVHASVQIDRVLKLMRERRAHMAIVVDEFGGTAGLVTLEDVLSELLGVVGDEFTAGDAGAEQVGTRQWRVPGAMPLDDLTLLLGKSWDTEAATVGGLVVESLGQLPTAGERTEIDGFTFVIEQVAGRAVGMVLITTPEPSSEQGEANA